MVPASGKQFRGGPALDRDRRCRRAAWEFPRWSVPLGGTRMKRSKSRAVMVVGACVSNVWSLWCGSPGMLRPARGSPTPTDRMFAPFRRLLPACPVVTTTKAQLDGGAVICNPGRASWEVPRAGEKGSLLLALSTADRPLSDMRKTAANVEPALSVGFCLAGSRAGPGRTPQPLWWSIREAPDDEA